MTHIVYGIDNKYLPCLLVSLFTAMKKVSGRVKVTVFTSGPEFDTSSIHTLVKNLENVDVEVQRFDTYALTAYENKEPAARFPAASMLPLFLPWLVKGKCLFLDADTLVLHDVSQLFEIDLDGSLIGACRSYSHALSIGRAFHSGYFFPLIYKNRKERYREKSERLGYSDIPDLASRYFSSGVILFDTDAIREEDPNCTLTNMENLEQLWVNGLILPDMDRLNHFFKDKVHYFNQKWDVPRDVSSFNRLYAPPDLWEEISVAIQDPGILHFSGLYMRKSWKRPWYTGARYRLYRRTCQEIHGQTGIDVAGMFDARE